MLVYKYADILGNGAFGTVRTCTEMKIDTPQAKKFRDGSMKQKAIESQIVQ